jgi:ribosomal protein S18 acetylase RimI-like enzyme
MQKSAPCSATPLASTDVVQIVPFDESRRADVIALWQACDLTRPWNDPHGDIDRALTNPSSTILMATDNGETIGSVMCGYDGHRGWVYYLAAAPSRRGDGIGRKLMTAAEDWLRDRGCPKIELMVRDTNTATLGFYDALEYERQPVEVLARWLIEPEGGSPTVRS